MAAEIILADMYCKGEVDLIHGFERGWIIGLTLLRINLSAFV